MQVFEIVFVLVLTCNCNIVFIAVLLRIILQVVAQSRRQLGQRGSRCCAIQRVTPAFLPVYAFTVNTHRAYNLISSIHMFFGTTGALVVREV